MTDLLMAGAIAFTRSNVFMSDYAIGSMYIIAGLMWVGEALRMLADNQWLAIGVCFAAATFVGVGAQIERVRLGSRVRSDPRPGTTATRIGAKDCVPGEPWPRRAGGPGAAPQSPASPLPLRAL